MKRFLYTVLLLIAKCLAEFNEHDYNTVFPNNEDDGTLKLVTVLFRHGNRTPEEKELYPTDPHLNLTYFPYGLGQLTNDNWHYLQELENKYALQNPAYMNQQPELNWNSRKMLVDWLATVCFEYNLDDQTFYLAISYIDRILCQVSVTKEKFQLVGLVAVLIATKMEEYHPIEVEELCFLTGDTFTTKQILKVERYFLRKLNFELHPPTIPCFIQYLVTEHKMYPKIVHLAMYIAELVILEGDSYLAELPSKLAAASIALARYMSWQKIIWPNLLKKLSKFSLDDLKPIIKRLNNTLITSMELKEQAIQNKYKKSEFNYVAAIKPRKLFL